MSPTTNVLITGSNRGIGKGLVSTFLSRPNHIVIAGVRDASSASSSALLQLRQGNESKLIIFKIDSASETEALDAVHALQTDHQITRLDVVIANAGISNYFGKASATPTEQMFEHFKVNAVGPLLLFQATAPLLNASSSNPRFVTISSGAGSMTNMDRLKNVENTAYGASKAAANFVTRRIHFENPNLIAFPINPGWLQTELGNHAAAGAGMPKAPMSVQDGVDGIIDSIDRATREETSGRFMNVAGEELGW